jgi:ATP-dependent helicase HrpB
LYDVKQTPTVANGRAKILLDILAPNFRTVQITDDLANFWNTLYPKIRTELSRRYPKHLWK